MAKSLEPVVDKNGVQTSRWKGTDAPKASKSASRIPKTAKSAVDNPTELDYSAMLARAKEIHPDARVAMNDGQWSIIIDTGIKESEEMPEEFVDTPVAIAWIKKPYDEFPTHIDYLMRRVYNSPTRYTASLEYNIDQKKHELTIQYADNLGVERGHRTLTEIRKVLAKDKNGFGDLSEAELKLFSEWSRGNLPGVDEYLGEHLRLDHASLESALADVSVFPPRNFRD